VPLPPGLSASATFVPEYGIGAGLAAGHGAGRGPAYGAIGGGAVAAAPGGAPPLDMAPPHAPGFFDGRGGGFDGSGGGGLDAPPPPV
jgi:hypothetical protein